MILLSRAEEIVLLAVFKLKADAYGVTIREHIHKDIGRYWAFGAIYRTLRKMKSKGYVEMVASDPIAERGGRRRYYYGLTPKGVSALEEIRHVNFSIWNEVRILSHEEKVK